MLSVSKTKIQHRHKNATSINEQKFYTEHYKQVSLMLCGFPINYIVCMSTSIG